MTGPRPGGGESGWSGESGWRGTLFVSSRMEELALERRAAFDAAYLAGFVPLLFETEPRGDSEKGKIDTLVDGSDYFLGLYYQTIGSKNAQLFFLEPIRYELYRFLLRFHDAEVRQRLEESGGTVTQGVKTLLDDKMQDRGGTLMKLRRAVAAGELDELVAERVLLFRKAQTYDSATSVSLEMMLSDFDQCRAFHSRLRQPLEWLADLEVEPGFHTARFDLFRQVLEELDRRRELVPGASRAAVGSAGGPDREQRWRLEGKDHPGILYIALRRLFSKGLNIKSLCVGRPLEPAADHDLVIDLVLAPFYPSDEEDPARDALTGIRGIVDSATRRLPPAEPGKQTVRPLSSKIAYAIHTADVPGMALRIAERIMRYGGNVEAFFLDTSHRALTRNYGFGRGVAIHLVAIEPVEPWGELEQLEFEADLQQGMGIMKFSRIEPERFHQLVGQVGEGRGETLDELEPSVPQGSA